MPCLKRDDVVGHNMAKMYQTTLEWPQPIFSVQRGAHSLA